MKSPSKLDCLDGLRALAVAMVILFHLGCAYGWETGSAMGCLLAPLRFGSSGVHLFLVLSGFCLTHAMFRRKQAGRVPGYPAYLAARWRRIAPPFYVAMALCLAAPALSLAIGRPSSSASWLAPHQVATHLLFIHGLWADTIDAISTPFWSLSLEFQFYLVFPLLFAAAERVGAARAVAAVAVLSLAWRGWLAWGMPGHGHLVHGFFLGRWTEFALGMGVAWWYQRADRGRVPWWAFAVASAATLAAAAAAVSRGVPHASDYLWGLGYAALVMATLVASERGAFLGRVAERPAWVALGVASYSLYLTHSLLLERGVQVYRRLIPRPGLVTDAVMVGAVLAIVLGGGWAFHLLVERRFLRSVDAPRAVPGESRPIPQPVSPAVGA